METVDSTNEEARRLADQGAAAGTVVWSRQQDAGRGREGRRWASPLGNLYCSILLRPDSPPAMAAQLAFVAGVAAADTVVDALPRARATVTCKWPNDILADGRKIAGMLIEAREVEGRLSWAILGIGINIAWHPPDENASLYPATSLVALGAAACDPKAVLVGLLARLNAALDLWTEHGFAPVRAAWLARAHGLGSQLNIRMGGCHMNGTFQDLDSDGALILETAGGRRRIVAGDVFPAAS